MNTNRWFLLGVYLTMVLWAGFLLVITELHGRLNIERGEIAVATGSPR